MRLVLGAAVGLIAAAPALAGDFPVPVRGIADTHAHQFANLAFGGQLFSGAPFAASGKIEDALPSCTREHGALGIGDVFGSIVRGRVGHDTRGAPSFTGWPLWNTATHQQMYVESLHRAFQGGLRLMVMLAVNTRPVCWLKTPAPGRTCDDMEAVHAQIQAAKDLEKHIDAQAGGPDKGWYRIVYSPQEAEKALRANQLAVVLGAEVDELFGCGVRGRCTEASVRAALEDWYARGVRHVVPIHFANNAFGGYAAFDARLRANNVVLTGHRPRMRDCGDAAPKHSPGRPQCNSEGLTPLGRFLIHELMGLGTMIDLDHMSWASIADLVDVTAARGYPLVSGHTGFIETSRGENRHEGQKSAAQMRQIAASHGLVSVILTQGKRTDVARWPGTAADPNAVDNDCGHSSKGWAQAYQYAVAALGGSASAAVGLASDQALNKWVGPRFGGNACDKDAADRRKQVNRICYPLRGFEGGPALEKSCLGTKTFDFNTDGFAHIGMLPDFVEDLRRVGVTDRQLEPLFRSAWAYVETWRRASGAANTK
jgi:microsomal dipeptidase-like Zn-dependent dipeptidase